MSLVFRLLAGLALVAALVAVYIWISRDTGPGAQVKPAAAMPGQAKISQTRQASGLVPNVWQSALDCKPCHAEVYAEWKGSHHQISYLNPEVSKLSDNFRNKECQACHLPIPISQTGYAKRTLPRQTQRSEGVSCLSCHLGKNGEILAVQDKPTAPCAPVASKDFASVELCASCHNQHQTTDQWRASPQAAKGISCNSCHMPEVLRAAGSKAERKGHGHVFHGAHQIESLRAAGKFSLSRNGDSIVLKLENVGAGHNFPTEERHRAVDMQYRFSSSDKQPGAWTRAYRFRSPYRDEVGEDTQLPAGQEKAVKIKIPAAAQLVEARLWYRLTPYVDDENPQSTLLEERRLVLR